MMHEIKRLRVVGELPRELYLEATNRCNLKCHTCPQAWGMPEATADLSAEEAARILDQFPSLDRVVLHGIGEPLLNPALPQIVALAKAKGAHVVFNSNGTTLKPAKVEPVIVAGLDELRVSLDAATPETFEAVRGAPAWPGIIKNLRDVVALKKTLGSERPRLSLWMTGLRENLAEVSDLLRLAADIGIGEVYLQRLVTSSRGLATLAQSLYGRGEADDVIARAEVLAKELGVVFRGSGATGARSSVRGAQGDAPWRGCRRPWSLMYLTARGTALPCCIAPFTAAPYESMRLGDCSEESVAEVWNGDRYQAWRAAMLEGEPPAACKGCGADWSL